MRAGGLQACTLLLWRAKARALKRLMFRSEASVYIVPPAAEGVQLQESDSSGARRAPERRQTPSCHPLACRHIPNKIFVGAAATVLVLFAVVALAEPRGDGLGSPTGVPTVPQPGPLAPVVPAPSPSPTPGQLPKVYTHPHLDISRVLRISRFRSGAGHDYSDSAESCRSMKHYFEFHDGAWDNVDVVAPMNGTIRAVREEWAGTQLEIEALVAPGLSVVIFHIDVRILHSCRLHLLSQIGRCFFLCLQFHVCLLGCTAHCQLD